ncbi:hypothetical protein D3C72_2185030 [compost metagenome]
MYWTPVLTFVRVKAPLLSVKVTEAPFETMAPESTLPAESSTKPVTEAVLTSGRWFTDTGSQEAMASQPAKRGSPARRIRVLANFFIVSLSSFRGLRERSRSRTSP